MSVPEHLRPAASVGPGLDKSACTFESLEWEWAYQYCKCPRRDGEVLLSGRTGECRPDYCGANWCPFCCHVRAGLYARALGRADPAALVTLTQVGDTWPQTRARMTALQQTLRRRSAGLALAWVVESASAGRHVHAMVHGPVPDRASWSAFAQRAGMGRQVDVRVVRETPLRVGQYLLKEMHRDPLGHLDLNGGRLVHASRTYWRVDGRQVRGARAAIVASRRPSRRDGRRVA